MEKPSHFERKNPDVIGKFISLTAELLSADMTQADYDKLREIAGILNPGGGAFGFVSRLNGDVERLHPHIQRRD